MIAILFQRSGCTIPNTVVYMKWTEHLEVEDETLRENAVLRELLAIKIPEQIINEHWF